MLCAYLSSESECFYIVHFTSSMFITPAKILGPNFPSRPTAIPRCLTTTTAIHIHPGLTCIYASENSSCQLPPTVKHVVTSFSRVKRNPEAWNESWIQMPCRLDWQNWRKVGFGRAVQLQVSGLRFLNLTRPKEWSSFRHCHLWISSFAFDDDDLCHCGVVSELRFILARHLLTVSDKKVTICWLGLFHRIHLGQEANITSPHNLGNPN